MDSPLPPPPSAAPSPHPPVTAPLSGSSEPPVSSPYHSPAWDAEDPTPISRPIRPVKSPTPAAAEHPITPSPHPAVRSPLPGRSEPPVSSPYHSPTWEAEDPTPIPRPPHPVRSAEHPIPPSPHRIDPPVSSPLWREPSPSPAENPTPPPRRTLPLVHQLIKPSPLRPPPPPPAAFLALPPPPEKEAAATGHRLLSEELGAVGLRFSAMALALVAFSVMVADRTVGWAGDSFDRYKEYRYLVSINVIAFVYSGFQVYAYVHYLITGKYILGRTVEYYFSFTMDQLLAYLLISASSSAATRTDAWVIMFGSDEFTNKASGSIAISFLAFVALALSSLISSYNLFRRNAK